MTRYFALIDGKAGAYGVTFPDLEGCASMGTSVDQALQNAISSLADFVRHLDRERIDRPEPRNVETLRSDPDVAIQLREGAFLASVPLIIETGKPIRANISMEAGLLDAIDAAAQEAGLTRSGFLASAAREKIFSRL